MYINGSDSKDEICFKTPKAADLSDIILFSISI